MPDLFDALSLIAASGVAAERATEARPSPHADDEDAVALAKRPSDRHDALARGKAAPVRRPRLLDWSR